MTDIDTLRERLREVLSSFEYDVAGGVCPQPMDRVVRHEETVRNAIDALDELKRERNEAQVLCATWQRTAYNQGKESERLERERDEAKRNFEIEVLAMNDACREIAVLKRKNREPREALAFKRNVIIDGERGAPSFIGRWVAVPAEDFDRARAPCTDSRRNKMPPDRDPMPGSDALFRMDRQAERKSTEQRVAEALAKGIEDDLEKVPADKCDAEALAKWIAERRAPAVVRMVEAAMDTVAEGGSVYNAVWDAALAALEG